MVRIIYGTFIWVSFTSRLFLYWKSNHIFLCFVNLSSVRQRIYCSNLRYKKKKNLCPFRRKGKNQPWHMPDKCILNQNILLHHISSISFPSPWKHSCHGFTENGSRQNIAQLWKLFSYITIRILKISFRNCVSSLQSTHYRAFLFIGPFDLTKAFNTAQKSIGTPKLCREKNINLISFSFTYSIFIYQCFVKVNIILINQA